MAFSNILPDPINKINAAGVSSPTGEAGPGFAAVSFRSVRDTQVSRTVSGRGVTRSTGGQYWEADINYHPLTRAQFEPVYSFLLSRNGRRDPFYVALPQYALPRDPTFAASVTTNTMFLDADVLAGSSSLVITSADITGSPSPGDMFNIDDGNNVNHTKAYRVTRVETSTVFETAGLTGIQRRVHFTPPLTKTTLRGLTQFSATSAGSNLLTKTAHGLAEGDVVRAMSTLTAAKTYYVRYVNANTFALSLTIGGAFVPVSTSVTIMPYPTKVVFTNPKMRCILKNDLQEYSLGTNNLFNFSLSIEEIQP